MRIGSDNFGIGSTANSDHHQDPYDIELEIKYEPTNNNSPDAATFTCTAGCATFLCTQNCL